LRSINNDVYDVLNNYYWQGNVRELQSVIWEACTNARLYNDNVLQEKHLRKELISSFPDVTTSINDTDDLELKKAKLELEAIDGALKKTYGRKDETAKLLDMKSADSLLYKVKKCAEKNPSIIKRYKNINKYYKFSSH